ncbi:MAG: hypothetical protein H6739_35160 [Alphaproteobacteria bacterium]|nr:hypothetical protein [Alphaproteobacteria bacterium]
MSETTPDRDPPHPSGGWAGFILAFFGIFLALATYQGELGAWRAGVMLLLAAVTLWFLQLFGDSMTRGHWPTLESHWGGLGGGLGGWRISPSLVYLLGALWFGGMLVVVAERSETAEALGLVDAPDDPQGAENPCGTPPPADLFDNR